MKKFGTESNGISEFSYGSFTRTVTLPDGADEDDISATYDRGILTVSVPVSEEEPAEKHVEVYEIAPLDEDDDDDDYEDDEATPTATGTTNWSVSGIVLQTGTNVVTVTAKDAANNTATASTTARAVSEVKWGAFTVPPDRDSDPRSRRRSPMPRR